MKSLVPSLADLLARITQLEERTSQAEERATRAEARADRLENATGNIAAAVVNPKAISRRKLLLKAAGVGAAGVAGSLLINRPKEALAAFVWNGGGPNVADLQTTVTAASGFPAGAVVLHLDANQTANATNPVDGLRSYGSAHYSGIASYGGNRGGAAYYGYGGPAVAGVRDGGSFLFGGSGTNVPGGTSMAARIYGDGASDGTAYGYGMYLEGRGSGYGLYAQGGRGTVATPHVNGAKAIQAFGGPGALAVDVRGDAWGDNNVLAADGLYAAGNWLGVGGSFQGGRAQVHLIPNGGIGAPTSGPHSAGDLYMDAKKVIWVCTVDGTPGTFQPLQPGGMNSALFTAVSTQQYTLTNSDGVTWTPMDSTNLKLTITPTFNCQAVITGSTDLWTATSGFNQDIGISVAGTAYPTAAGQPEAWKESGGSAGTYSPNAAHVDTIVPLAAGVAYTIQLVWKTNHAGTSMIACGAGPIGGKFSPTRLTAWLVPTNPGGTIPRTPEVPYTRPAPEIAAPEFKDPYGRKV